MTTFTDGPAAGISLMIRRLPTVLRVVRDPQGKWDALDQLTDLPDINEQICVYRLKKVVGKVCLRPGGCYPIGEYEYITDQPDDETARSIRKWRVWAMKKVAEYRGSDQ